MGDFVVVPKVYPYKLAFINKNQFWDHPNMAYEYDLQDWT